MLLQRFTRKARQCGRAASARTWRVRGSGPVSNSRFHGGAQARQKASDCDLSFRRRRRRLFEQATAVMAAGDFVDAELRLKEFVLLYPDYPGAYVNLAIIHATTRMTRRRGRAGRGVGPGPGSPCALEPVGHATSQKWQFSRGRSRLFEGRHSFTRLRLGTLQPGRS